MSEPANFNSDLWERARLEQVWDVFAKHDMAFDRLSMYHDEGADSEFCEMHRRALAGVLDEAGLVSAQAASDEREPFGGECACRDDHVSWCPLAPDDKELRSNDA